MSEPLQELRNEVEMLKNQVESIESKLEKNGPPDEGGNLRSLVKEFGPSTHVERALIIGYHFERYQGKENFASNEIEEAYREAKLQNPANMSDVLAKTGRKGLMRRDGEEDGYQMWMLTLEGEERVEEVIQ